MNRETKIKGPAISAACPQVDTNYASNRTQELMYQLAQFRAERGLPPSEMSAHPYRKEGLKPMAEGKTYEL